MNVRLALLVLLFACTSGCGRECAIPADTRCDGEIAEVCDTDGHWQPFLDCTDIGVDWVCAEVPTGSTCLPAVVPDAGDVDGGHA